MRRDKETVTPGPEGGPSRRATSTLDPPTATARPWSSPLTWAFGAVVAVGSVLRLWDLSHPTLIPDESFSAIVAHRPFFAIPGFVAGSDPHPPLSYLLMWPVLQVSQSEWALRLGSAVLAVGSLVLLAWWQSRRADRVEGLMATALFALLPFQMILTREARMYGLMIFLGVAGAWAAWQWLEQPSRRLTVLIGVVVLAAAFSHGMGFILGLGVMLLPGLRRDRASWELRIAVGVSGLLFAAAWGRSLLDQRGGSLYPTTTISGLTTTINELIVPVPGNRIVMLPLVALGGVLLWRHDQRMGRVWLSLFAIPVVLVALMGLAVPMVIPKTFMVISWGPPLALAACVGAGWRRWRPLGAATLAILGFLTVPYLPQVLSPERTGTDASQALIDALDAVVEPGDALAIHPSATLVPWYFGDRPGDRSTPLDLGLPDTVAWVPDGPAWTGRVWLVDTLFAVSEASTDLPECAAPQTIGGNYRVRCLEVPK